MPIFESKQRKLFKMIKSLSDAGAVDQAAARVEPEMKVLLESPEVARELVAYLMDIGYPDLAARAGEDIIRQFKDLAGPVLRLLEERQADFPRSFELLRTLWQVKLRQRDFSGAIEVLGKVDRSNEAKLSETLETAARNAERFAADRLLEGDIDRFVGWSLALFRRGRVQEALDTMLKVAQRSSRPDDRVPALIEWIGTRKGDRDPLAVLYLVRAYLAAENVELALRNIPDLFEASPEIVSQAVTVVEKDLLPLDLSSRGKIYFARLLTVAGRIEDACREIEKLLDAGEMGIEVDAAVKAVASAGATSARPLLLFARFKKARGENTAALDALEQAFTCSDVAGSPISETATLFLNAGIDRDGSVARKLGEFLVESGTTTEAVEALSRVVTVDPEWVQAQLQKLLVKDKNSAEILALLAVTMQVRGRESEATATMKHLSERKDRKSREDVVLVLSRFDSLMDQFPGLRRMRASVRAVAGREGEAAADWFSLLLKGEHVPAQGLAEIEQAGFHRTHAADLLASPFTPENAAEAFLAGLAALNVNNFAKASIWLETAAADASLAPRIAEQVAFLPDNSLHNLDLERLLALFSAAGASKTAADIILRTSGSDPWRMELVSKLTWGDPPAELLFRLRAYLAEGRVALAGSATSGASITDPALAGLAEFCASVSVGAIPAGLAAVKPALADRRTSSLAAGVLRMLLDTQGADEASVRRALAATLSTDGRIPDAVAILEPVMGQAGITEQLEDLASENPSLAEAPMMLVRSAATVGDIDRMRKWTGVVLDIDAGRAAEIESICEKSATGRNGGQALVFAAELSDKYHLSADPDSLLTKAILTDPSVAAGLAGRKGSGPSFKALCSLASGDSNGFVDVLRRRAGLEIPLNKSIADAALSRWRPGTEGEALLHLASALSTANMEDRSASVLSAIAREGIGAWRAEASARLLTFSLEGKAPRKLFWDSVRDPEMITQALESDLGQQIASRPVEEIASAAGAVLAAGLDPGKVLEFGLLLVDKEGVSGRLGEVAAWCMEKWRKGKLAGSQELVRVLLGASLMAEASEVAMSSPDDKMLATVTEALDKHRTVPPAEGLARARHLFRSGDMSGCMEALQGVVGEEADDIRGLTLWRLGRRNAAISLWHNSFKENGSVALLRRLHWALGEAGYGLDRIALEKYAELHCPEALAGLAVAAVGPRRLNTISML
jgi:tetratricopeptide (TPR) repeat protein